MRWGEIEYAEHGQKELILCPGIFCIMSIVHARRRVVQSVSCLFQNEIGTLFRMKMFGWKIVRPK
jgi:hypothetical protein